MDNKLKTISTIGIGIIAIILVVFLSSCPRNSMIVSPINSDKSKAPGLQKSININVFLENSGSMDGYVNGQTEFKDAVFSCLDNLATRCNANLNLCYINSEIIHCSNSLIDFIRTLTPATFKSRGGSRGTSDIGNVLSQVLNNTNKKGVSILISDCILSPGAGNNASDYKMQQQILIKSVISNYIKTKDPNLAIVVYKLESRFNGLYYNIFDNPTKINDVRPYYIWLIGNRDLIYRITEESPSSSIKCDNINTFAMAKNTNIKYAISDNLNTMNPNSIKKDALNVYHFKVMGNFRETLQDNSYILDKNNYKTNCKDTYTIENIVCIPDAEKYGYSHIISISSSKPSIGAFSLKLNANMPKWVGESNDKNGININAKGAMSQTFGIENILGGVRDAFADVDYYTEIKLNIELK